MLVNAIDPEEEDETELKYDFQTSFIYKYMKWTFQCTCETDWFKQTQCRKLLYTLGQIAVLLVGCSYYGFHCYMLHLNNYLAHMHDVFNAILDLIYHFTSSFEVIGFLTLGHYTMKRHPSLVQDQIECIKKLLALLQEDTEEVDIMIKKSERQVYDCIAVGGVILLLMPLITNMLFIANMHWNKEINSTYRLSILMLVSEFIIRLLAMPFLFVTFFTVRLQRIQLKLLFNKIEKFQNDEDVTDIFNSYTNIHKSISKVDKTYSAFVIYLILSFGLEGSVGIYAEIVDNIDFFRMPGLTKMDIIYAAICIAYYVASSYFELLLPILEMATVSRDQMKVAPMLLKSTPGRADFRNVHRIAHSIDLFQRSEGAGYKIFNSPITRWKAVSWVMIGPIVKMLFSRLI